MADQTRLPAPSPFDQPEIVHPTIRASCVVGVQVRSLDGDAIGVIEDLVVDRNSGRVGYALVELDAAVDPDRRPHPVAWRDLAYDADRTVYTTPAHPAGAARRHAISR